MASQPMPDLAASAMNALAHAIEALYTPLANPVAELAALRAAALIARGLDRSGPDRTALALGALLAGYASGVAGFAVHHAVCQTIVRVAGTPARADQRRDAAALRAHDGAAGARARDGARSAAALGRRGRTPAQRGTRRSAKLSALAGAATAARPSSASSARALAARSSRRSWSGPDASGQHARTRRARSELPSVLERAL